METRSNILHNLDHISLAQIFSYLNTSDVLLNLSLTCKDFHRIVTTSPYITKSLFENLFGRKITRKDMSNLTYARLQEVLKDSFLHKPLPFFGFRGNCGCDKNNSKYLFDKIFEFREERSVVCTDSGENFDVEGVLSDDYAREAKYIQNIISALGQTDQSGKPLFPNFQHLLQRGGSRIIDLFPFLQNDPLCETIKPLRELRQEKAKCLQDRNDKYHIEIPCQKMMRSIGLIQSCHLKREVKGLTCPIKTLVAFASLNEEIGSSSLPSLFSECKTSNDLLQLLNNHKEGLPDIAQTSIKGLAELSSHIKYQDEEEDAVEFVVFKSNGKKRDVIPLFWVNFNKPIHKDLFLNFKDCNFSGRYVMLKLIQCEDLRLGSFHPDSAKNVDMAFCCFYGPVLDF